MHSGTYNLHNIWFRENNNNNKKREHVCHARGHVWDGKLHFLYRKCTTKFHGNRMQHDNLKYRASSRTAYKFSMTQTSAIYLELQMRPLWIQCKYVQGTHSHFLSSCFLSPFLTLGCYLYQHAYILKLMAITDWKEMKWMVEHHCISKKMVRNSKDGVHCSTQSHTLFIKKL